MAIKNEVRLIGRITKDFTGFNRDTAQGSILIGQVPIAVERPRGKNGKTTTDFIKLKFIGNRWQGVSQYLTKGTQVAICGQLQTGQYEDKEGNVHYTVDVLVEGLELLHRAKKEENDDDLPF